jgi:glycine/serine hydroxymethyltransferase
MNNFFTANISEVDPLISEAIDDEVRRQTDGLELIASGEFRVRGCPAGDGYGVYEQVR